MPVIRKAPNVMRNRMSTAGLPPISHHQHGWTILRSVPCVRTFDFNIGSLISWLKPGGRISCKFKTYIPTSVETVRPLPRLCGCRLLQIVFLYGLCGLAARLYATADNTPYATSTLFRKHHAGTVSTNSFTW